MKNQRFVKLAFSGKTLANFQTFVPFSEIVEEEMVDDQTKSGTQPFLVDIYNLSPFFHFRYGVYHMATT